MHTKDRRKATITEAGSSRDALARPWKKMPLGSQHRPVLGTLNGRRVDFVVTSGSGFHYAYFAALGQIWYVDTGEKLLSEGGAIDFVGEKWLTAPIVAPHA